MAAGVEVLPLARVLEVNERGEEQDHVAALVHDGRAAVGAGDLAGELVHAGFLAGLVPSQVVVAVREVDIFFVEDGGPLEGGACCVRQYTANETVGEGERVCTVDLLACGAMAVFRVKRLLAAQLVSDLPAVTAALVADFEIGIVALDFVGSTEFPLVELALGAAVVAVVTVGAVALCISHLGKEGMELGL